MSLIYRAIWDDDRPDLIQTAGGTFLEWLQSKNLDITELPSDPLQVVLDGKTTTIEAHRVEADGVEALEAKLVEETEGERWMTRLLVLARGDRSNSLWVDLERVANDIYRQQEVAAPRLVRQLIDDGAMNGGRPRVGPVELRTSARALRPTEVDARLISVINDQSRSTPLIVFSHDSKSDPKVTMERANAAALTLAGVATVVVLPPDSQEWFESTVGRDLSVWDGAVRIYLPGSLEPSRHRYIRQDLISRHRREAGRRIASMLTGPISARRAPADYERVRSLLRGGADWTLAEYVELQDDEIESLRRAIDDLSDRHLSDVAEIDELNRELDGQQGKARALRLQLRSQRGEEIAAEEEVPSEVTRMTDVADACRLYLPRVVLHDEACVDLEQMDTVVEAEAWARSAWRAARALNAYALESSEFNGGFYQWCQHSKSPDTWPATTKKLAMSESDSVMNSPKLRSTRNLPISKDVDPRGQVEMQAHIKVAEGGGPGIPRIYFYDDAKGATGKIHIGFFGPHRHMPNASTN